MGMFDIYLPVPELLCPNCGKAIRKWQGKDGPCALLVWKQGEIAPIDQPIDEDLRLEKEQIAEFRLPEKFTIYSDECNCSTKHKASCETKKSCWAKTKMEKAKKA